VKAEHDAKEADRFAKEKLREEAKMKWKKKAEEGPAAVPAGAAELLLPPQPLKTEVKSDTDKAKVPAKIPSKGLVRRESFLMKLECKKAEVKAEHDAKEADRFAKEKLREEAKMKWKKKAEDEYAHSKTSMPECSQHLHFALTHFPELMSSDAVRNRNLDQWYPSAKPSSWVEDSDGILHYTPSGWLRIGLSGSCNSTYTSAYHGTTLESAHRVLQSGLLLHSDHTASARVQSGHVPTGAIFVSPTPIYSGHPIYARPVKHTGAGGQSLDVQVMFEVRVAPGSFDDPAVGGKMQHTFHHTTWPKDLCFEPTLSDGVVEWWTTNSRFLSLHAILFGCGIRSGNLRDGTRN
jgi:hypothetical protein